MEFIKGDIPSKTGQENMCLVWVYDSEIEIGYCNPELGYFEDGQWWDFDGDPLNNAGVITHYAYVPKARNSRKPKGTQNHG